MIILTLKIFCMKKSLLVLVSFFVTLSLSAQKTVADVFAPGEVVWYGLDFSNARFIGIFGSGSGSGEDIRDNLMPAWNSLIVLEPAKYDMGKTFVKEPVINYLDAVGEINANIDASNLIDINPFKFESPEELIASAVSQYNYGEKDSGLGLVFIVESFDKARVEASLYVTFFDISTKEVLLTERMTGKPVGFGLRNHWGGGIYNILKQIQASAFKDWQTKYN
mgnify:FL=1